jgi:hypothetical protein
VVLKFDTARGAPDSNRAGIHRSTHYGGIISGQVIGS